MNLSKETSELIVQTAKAYLGREFDLATFNCVHFVREVYQQVGIVLPLLARYDIPPSEFHLSEEEFALMPVGHCVFFKRKNTRLNRHWTHVAIVFSADDLIHCTRNIGRGVVVTSKEAFLEIYQLSRVV